MLSTISPYPNFVGLDGHPLEDGSVYYGVANQNPLISPIQVYWDEAGTIPAAQPIKTVAGYQFRNGSPALVYAGVPYSILVQDKRGIQVFYAADSSVFSNSQILQDQIDAFAGQIAAFSTSSGSGLVGWVQAGTGAVLRTVSDKLRDQVTILDFMTPAQIADVKSGSPLLDVTNPVQAAIDAAATANRELIWIGSCLTGLLSSASPAKWRGEPGARVILRPGVYAANTFHVSLAGDSVILEDLVIDGNQLAMSSGQGTNALFLGGKSPSMSNVTVRNSAMVGLTLTSNNTASFVGTKQGAFVSCHFDDNAGLGMNTIAAAYHGFHGCTFDRNGYGFQKTRANYADTGHGFVAFGAAVRLRSHHFEFIGCSARDNGRDGLNVNQGSYAIKFAQCLAYGNDDGGFTIASDNTGSGLPGEGEACYDIEYVGCEAYNNFTSGLAAYQAAYNVSVVGGRYYNNHRVAGFLADASSYFSGIYFAAGSSGIFVDTKAYDERQSRVISSVSGSGTTRILTAAGWVPGSMNYYPKVAVYSGSDLSFLGYGQITSEFGGSVTIQSTAFNGVALGSLAAGMYVTQAVQHNGCFFDNSSIGSVAVDGFGHRAGVNAGYTGRNIALGYFGNNANVILPKERRGETELLTNPTFDAGIANWAFVNPTGGSATSITAGAFRRSTASLQIVGGTTVANSADAGLVVDALRFCLGEFVEFGGWVYASSRGDAVLFLFTALGSNFSAVSHPGGGWRYLKIGLQVSPTDAGLVCRIQAAVGKTIYADSMSLRPIEMHTDNREFAPDSRSLPF